MFAMNQDNQTPGPGHNSGSQEDQIRDNIRERHPHLEPRASELLKTAQAVPAEISEEIAGKVADFIKSISAHIKAIDGARSLEKEPYIKGGRIVDGLFKKMAEPLETAKKELEKRLGIVLRAKEERERREAAEKARREREEAEERKRVADELARKQREEAEAAKRAAEEAERKQREEADRIRREAEERRLAAEAEERRAREESERLQREAQEAEARAERARKEENRLRAEAEAKAKADEAARIEAERQARAKAAEEEQARLDHLARRKEYDADLVAEAAGRDVRKVERDAAQAERYAAKVGAHADAAEAKERAVETAKPKDFGSIRGDYGALATPKEFWTFVNMEKEAIDLEVLRPHLATEAVEAALRRAIAAGLRSIRGADIIRDQGQQVR